MDYNEIATLLDKYFEGNTSLAEEKILKEYFTQTQNVAPELLYAKDMFAHFEKELNVKYVKPTDTKGRILNIKNFIRLSSIAASIVVLLGIAFLLTQKPSEEIVYAYINGKPITNKDLAMLQTKKALFLISDNLNQGTKELHQISKFNEIEQQITKTK
jgi:hypothetical protein